ncbi:2-dehydropantoate 2-reductase [Chakrabartyella piscis]|uniref:ketopantoate reductase family protein n=1 Tax=Chakrabartyella piscis TaxID=2918914 RepID=UPI002958751C|nr:2-dehydropantoate 2-reductase [Chakrabartyella piscis]
MKIAIIGLGGVGGTVAGGFKEYEKDLIFVARGETKKVLQANGLYLESKVLGNKHIQPSLVSDDPKEIGIVDVVFLCCKAYGLESCCKSYGDIIGENTVVIPLVNGVVGRRMVEQYLGGKGIVTESYIYCFSNILEVGKVSNVGDGLFIGIGFSDGTTNETAEKVAEILTKGGLRTTYGKDIMTALWKKYSVVGANSCVFIYYDCIMGDVQQSPERLEYLRNVSEDIIRLATASGVTGLEGVVDKNMKDLMKLPPQSMTSLYRDLKAGKTDTEFEWLIGSGCQMAKELGIKVPYMDMAYGKKEYYQK